MHRLLIAAALSVSAAAEEVGPCTVLYVVDGDTVVVATPTAPRAETAVRLKWVDTPERHDNPHSAQMAEGEPAAAFLRAALPRGASVTLWSPVAAIERDRLGRLVALVRIRPADALADAPSDDWPSAQERIVRAGWSVYWRRYGDAPAPLHEAFLRCERDARSRRRGAWETARDWMESKRSERPGRQPP